MDKQDDRQTYGTFVVLWDPDFEAVRTAMEEIERQIERHKDEIDPATIETRVRYGGGPFYINLSWQAKGRKPVEEKKPPDSYVLIYSPKVIEVAKMQPDFEPLQSYAHEIDKPYNGEVGRLRVLGRMCRIVEQRRWAWT